MKCAPDKSRVERCVACESKCEALLSEWASISKAYNWSVEKHLKLEKYERGVVIVPKKSSDISSKSCAVLDADGKIESIISLGELEAKCQNGMEVKGKRIIGLSGYEYIPVITVKLQKRDLNTGAAKKKTVK